MDPITRLKEDQRRAWAHFLAVETVTLPAAAELVRTAGDVRGRRVLDVACGTGNAAITAARLGAVCSAVDLTSELLARARENSEIAGVDADWLEGDVEALPYGDATFDVVLSNFGHMFAPRPAMALGEMLRVLRPGGVLTFTSWPPEMFVGRVYALLAEFAPAPPVTVPPLVDWGEPATVRERLAGAIHRLDFARRVLWVPALSPEHYRLSAERTVGALVTLTETLAAERLAELRRRFDELIARYLDGNRVRQDYLVTRAEKL